MLTRNAHAILMIAVKKGEKAVEHSALTELIKKAIGDMSRNEFCRQAGLSAGNFSRIMKGQRPTPDVLYKIARVSGGVSYGELMRRAGYIEGERTAEEKKGIPIYGSIAAGSPIEAFENLSGYIRVEYPEEDFGRDCFALRVVGNSMDMANMPDGCTVVIRRGAEVAEGEIGAVLINGDATIKRVFNRGTHLVLARRAQTPSISRRYASRGTR